MTMGSRCELGPAGGDRQSAARTATHALSTARESRASRRDTRLSPCRYARTYAGRWAGADGATTQSIQHVCRGLLSRSWNADARIVGASDAVTMATKRAARSRTEPRVSRRDDVGAVLSAIRRLVRALHASHRDAEQRWNVSAAQLLVLDKLSDAPAHSVNELAERTLTHQSTVSVVVARLVRRGLVRRQRSSLDA